MMVRGLVGQLVRVRVWERPFGLASDKKSRDIALASELVKG